MKRFLAFTLFIILTIGGFGQQPNFNSEFIKFKSIISGVWVKSDFIYDLMKTKSPYKSSNKLKGIVTMWIDTSKIVNDSLFIGTSINNHEGYFFFALLKPPYNSKSISTSIVDYENKSNYFELGYEVKNNDTSVVLYHYNKDKKVLDTVPFTKVLPSQADTEGADKGLEYEINKLLFTGAYRFSDSAGTHEFHLKNDGKIIGYMGYSKYFVQSDFVAGPENNIDILCFDNDCFAYKIFHDSIVLYDVHENEDHTSLNFDKQRFVLFKQSNSVK